MNIICQTKDICFHIKSLVSNAVRSKYLHAHRPPFSSSKETPTNNLFYFLLP